MKRPRPIVPTDSPPRAYQIGGPIDWFMASLSVWADDLLPSQVTRLLKAQPTSAQVRGTPIYRSDGSIRRTTMFGSWSRTIECEETDEWDVAEVVRLLFEGLPSDVNTWQEVRKLGEIEIRLGLSLDALNRDFVLDPDLIQLLGERYVQIVINVYRDDEA